MACLILTPTPNSFSKSLILPLHVIQIWLHLCDELHIANSYLDILTNVILN